MFVWRARLCREINTPKNSSVWAQNKNKHQCRQLFTLQSPTSAKIVVKNSKFFAFAETVTTRKDALRFVERVSNEKATHNCFAYKVGKEERANDDGEVAGTAGKQILSGGLSRAYSEAASKCLTQDPSILVGYVPKAIFRCRVLFSSMGSFNHVFNSFPNGCILKEEVSTNGVLFTLSLPEEDIKRFRKRIILPELGHDYELIEREG